MHKKHWSMMVMVALLLPWLAACTPEAMAAWQEVATGSDTGRATNEHVVIDPEMDAYMQAHEQTGRFMGSVLVARGDEIIHSAGYGMADLAHDVPNRPDTKFRIGSLTKQFTAAAILQLQDEGLVDVMAPLSTYLPDYPSGDQLTLQNLLAQTSGIPNLTSFPDYFETMSEPTTLTETIASFAEMPLEFEPGSQFGYSNSNYIVLSAVIEAVTGQTYPDYIEQELLAPAGLEDTGYLRPNAIIEDEAEGYVPEGDGFVQAQFIHTSLPSGAGALYSTVLDLHEWWRLLRDGEVLSDAAREQLFTPVIEFEGGSYAFGWFTSTLFGRPIIAHDGGINGFFAYMQFFPTEPDAKDESAVVIVLSNVEGAPSVEIANGLSAILFGESYTMPEVHTAIDVDPARLEPYVGRYEAESGFRVTVTLEDGQLYVQAEGQPRFAIYPESETDFFLRAVEAQVSFTVDDNGEVSSMVLTQGGTSTDMPKIE